MSLLLRPRVWNLFGLVCIPGSSSSRAWRPGVDHTHFCAALALLELSRCFKNSADIEPSLTGMVWTEEAGSLVPGLSAAWLKARATSFISCSVTATVSSQGVGESRVAVKNHANEKQQVTTRGCKHLGVSTDIFLERVLQRCNGATFRGH